MKQLNKLAEPQILLLNRKNWTEEYTTAPDTDRKKFERWGAIEIRETLNIETLGKCAYCEGQVADISFPHVEHIIPKKIRPDLAHVWANLTLACQRCNNNKRDYYNPDLSIIDPYTDDIQEYLRFHGGFVTPNLGKIRGDITVSKLKLNRMELVSSRLSRVEGVRQMLERWFSAKGEIKEFLAEAISLDADEGEFSSTVWEFLNYMGFECPKDNRSKL